MSVQQNISILAINQTAVIMDVNVLQCNKEDSTLFQIIDEVQFYPYPHCTGTGYSNFNALPRDTILVKAQFHVKQGTNINQVILNSITAGIYAVRQNEIEEFPLEEFVIGTSGFLPNCDNIQEIDFSQPRDFILPTGDCRNEIRLFRMPTLDIEGYSAYELIYPFKVRWEEWRELSGASRCFTAPTQNWMVYSNTTGWSIKFSIKAEVEKRQGSYETYPREFQCTDAVPQITNFEHITWGSFIDPCSMPYSVEFNTYDTTETQSFEEVVATDVDTKVVATITGDFSGFTADQLYGILAIDAWGIGGVAYTQEIGTRSDVDANGVWYGSGSTLRATITKVSNNTLTLSAFLDYEYLPQDTNQIIFSASIGLFNTATSSSGGNICLNEILVDQFTCGELQIIEVLDENRIIVSGNVETQDLRMSFVDQMILTFVTSTSWTISSGTINGNTILSGNVGGNIIAAPTHPYTNSIVGDVLQGEITGTIYSSIDSIDGIGDMQIGCSFFVS